jgi:hypothetical protein
MVADGVENCISCICNFDVEKYNNPFSYFTQTIFYAFLRRIQKEKDYLYTKYKYTEHLNVVEETAERQEHDMYEEFGDGVKMGEWSEEYMNNFVGAFEDRVAKKRKKKKIVLDEDSTFHDRH